MTRPILLACLAWAAAAGPARARIVVIDFAAGPPPPSLVEITP